MSQETSRWYKPEVVQELKEVFELGVSVAHTRMSMQSTGMSVHPPIGGQESAEQLRTFYIDAMNGFMLSSRAGTNLDQQKVIDFIEQHGPINQQSVREELLSMGILWNPRTLETSRAEKWYRAYAFVTASLLYLTLMEKVTYNTFEYLPNGMTLVPDEYGTSYWTRRIDPNNILEHINELFALTKSVQYQQQEMDPGRVIKVGHFFSAGFDLISPLQ